ncbi:MAG TPA: hypothetical protein PK728_03580 [Bacillota bacterium]|nr:hypothetical protein [Bacillota bacterium]
MQQLAYSKLPPFFLGGLAAFFAWHVNRMIGSRPPARQVYIAPLAEEALKTLPAVFFSVDIFFTHFFFGAAEGIWETIAVRRNGFYAGLSSLASHSVFGCLTFLTYNFFGNPVTALAAGCLAHTAWNFTVLEFFPARKSGGRR